MASSLDRYPDHSVVSGRGIDASDDETFEIGSAQLLTRLGDVNIA